MQEKDKKIVGKAYSFDDVSLIPRESAVSPREVDIKTRLTNKIGIQIPFLSAAMDTVTESRMAIALARLGGLGVIHKNLSIEQQVKEVMRVKRSENGMILNPMVLSPDQTLEQALDVMKEYHISGLPVTEGKKLVGILTNRDVRFEDNFDKKVRDLMTYKNLITAPMGTTLEQAKEIFKRYKVEKLMLVDDNYELKGLITIKDLQKVIDYPLSTKDARGRLRVGAAIGTKDAIERATALVGADIDVLVLDSAHGHHKGVLEAVKQVKSNFPDIDLIAGNVATGEATDDLIKAGVDAIKVGIGPGSICTTRVIAGVGVPQLSAIMNCVEKAKKYHIPVIADGGIKQTGDVVKALAGGADTVMMGNVFAGTEESPGEIINYGGKTYKSYRGMGSEEAMQKGSGERYFQTENNGKFVPEGISGRVSFDGKKLTDVVYQFVGGLRAGMGYLGSKTIEELQKDAQFIQITSAGLKESHPHDVQITREAPNYLKK